MIKTRSSKTPKHHLPTLSTSRSHHQLSHRTNRYEKDQSVSIIPYPSSITTRQHTIEVDLQA